MDANNPILKDTWLISIMDGLAENSNKPENIAYKNFLNAIGAEQQKIREFGYKLTVFIVPDACLYNNLENDL